MKQEVLRNRNIQFPARRSADACSFVLLNVHRAFLSMVIRDTVTAYHAVGRNSLLHSVRPYINQLIYDFVFYRLIRKLTPLLIYVGIHLLYLIYSRFPFLQSAYNERYVGCLRGHALTIYMLLSRDKIHTEIQHRAL